MIRLKQCIRNRNHWYSDHAGECPWCRILRENRTDFFPGTPEGDLAVRQTVGKETAVPANAPAPPKIPSVPGGRPKKSRKTVYFAAIIGVIVLIPVALFLSGTFFSSAGTGPGAQSSPVTQKMMEVNRLFQQKDYAGTIAAADEVLSQDPANVYALNMKGMALRLNGDNGKALDIFDQLLQIDPGFSNAWAQKGWAYQALGRYQDMADAFDTAIRLESNVTTTKYSWYGKGQALTALKRYDEAISAFNTALRIDPDYAECYSQIGKVYRSQGRYDEAIASIDKAIAMKPDYGYAWTEKGWTYEKMEQWDAMLDAFENALRVGGDTKLQSQAWDGKGNAFVHLQRYDEAISAYDTAIQLNPVRFETYTHKGKLLVSQGRFSDAVTEFDKTIERNPDYTDAWWYKAVALENLGDHAGAETARAKAAALDPEKYGSKTIPIITVAQTPAKAFILF